MQYVSLSSLYILLSLYLILYIICCLNCDLVQLRYILWPFPYYLHPFTPFSCFMALSTLPAPLHTCLSFHGTVGVVPHAALWPYPPYLNVHPFTPLPTCSLMAISILSAPIHSYYYVLPYGLIHYEHPYTPLNRICTHSRILLSTLHPYPLISTH